VAVVYAVFRLVEAWGLWGERVWAEWVAVIGGSIYLPLELNSLLHGIHWAKITLLVLNLMIVGYRGLLLRKRNRERWVPSPS